MMVVMRIAMTIMMAMVIPAKVPKLYTAIGVVTRELGISDSPSYSKTHSPFSLANITTLEDAFIQAGFKDVSFEYLNVIFEFASAEDYTYLLCQ
jgi:hypothetical protein